jgi:hypothetical protein
MLGSLIYNVYTNIVSILIYIQSCKCILQLIRSYMYHTVHYNKGHTIQYYINNIWKQWNSLNEIFTRVGLHDCQNNYILCFIVSNYWLSRGIVLSLIEWVIIYTSICQVIVSNWNSWSNEITVKCEI